MELRTTDLAVLIIYMAGVFGLGCWFARKSGSTQEFMAAGRSLPGWAVGMSIFGTYVSSIGFLGNTGKAFGGTWNSWVFGLSLPIAAVIAVRWFVPLYRRRNVISAYSQLEDRFGPWARIYALVCFLLSQLARIGTILYLVALALAPLTGWDVKTIIVVTGLLVTIYTLLGGIEAVIWTDVVQSVVLIAGAILCAGIVLTEMPGGPEQLFEVANASDKFSLGSFSLEPETLMMAEPTFWMVLLYGVFINLQNFGADQGFVQRYITAKTDEDAKFSVWMGTIMFPVVSILFFFIGTGLFSLYHTDSALLDEVRTEDAENELQNSGMEVSTESAVAIKVAKLTKSAEKELVGEKLAAMRAELQTEELEQLDENLTARTVELTERAAQELSDEKADPTESAVAARASELAERELVDVPQSELDARVPKLWDKEIADKVLPHFIVRKLPAGLAGLLIAAIFAAAMSSVDTSLNSSASLVLCDVYQRYINPETTERQSMRVLYGSTLLFGVGGTLTSLAMINVKSALDVWWNLQGIFSGGMLGLFLLGMISKRAKNPQAIIAGTIGLLVIIWLSLTQGRDESWANPLHSFMTIVVGTSSIVLIGMLAGLFAAPANVPTDRSQQE